jgi:hypothetical protein
MWSGPAPHDRRKLPLQLSHTPREKQSQLLYLIYAAPQHDRQTAHSGLRRRRPTAASKRARSRFRLRVADGRQETAGHVAVRAVWPRCTQRRPRGEWFSRARGQACWNSRRFPNGSNVWNRSTPCISLSERVVSCPASRTVRSTTSRSSTINAGCALRAARKSASTPR